MTTLQGSLSQCSWHEAKRSIATPLVVMPVYPAFQKTSLKIGRFPFILLMESGIVRELFRLRTQYSQTHLSTHNPTRSVFGHIIFLTLSLGELPSFWWYPFELLVEDSVCSRKRCDRLQN